MENIHIFETKLGNIRIEENNNAITCLQFVDSEFIIPEGYSGEEPTPLLVKTRTQIQEYIAGIRRDFDIPLNYSGTNFLKSVLEVVSKIPYGEKWSYKQVAEAIDNPYGARAIGNVVNKNPLLILIPCHRVVGSNGKLVGYVGGLDRKKKLLELEMQKGSLWKN